MSGARKIINDKPNSSSTPSAFSQWFSYIGNTTRYAASFSTAVFQWCYANGRLLGWFVVTTGLITALPLVLEIKREGLLEELEKAQIAQEIAAGKTPMELSHAGLSGAIAPKVLS